MTDDQKERIKRVLGRTFRCASSCGGLHHLPPIKWSEHSASINAAYADLSTWDFNRLTALVIGAHDECIRVEVSQGGPRAVKITCWPRQREGSMSERHPTIEAAIEQYRGKKSAGVREGPV